MKTLKKTIILITILLISSCSSDNNTEEEQTIPEQATINSYSKNYGYSGENVIISGTNFTTDLDKVKVFFDEELAEINSVNNQEINIKLPNTENSVPVLKIEIENRIITNNVENDYNGNIGILANSLNQWHKISGFGVGDDKVWKMQIIGRERTYFSLNNNGAGGHIYRTIDGGITWKLWYPVGIEGSFYATSNDEGWCQTTFGVDKVPIGGSSNASLNSDVHPSTSTIGLYINDNLTKGFLISYKKIVFTTIDGITFNEIYNNDPTSTEDPWGHSSQVRTFSELDENHIWAGGDIKIGQNYAPLILFSDNGSWAERSIPGLVTSSRVEQIQFINENKGYIYVKNRGTNSSMLNQLYKSIDGGNSWELLYDSSNLPITSFNFKNENIGWFCSGNKIYKTIDGGINWTIDYTNNSDIKNISYNNGIVWAVTSNEILKYFTE